MSEFTKGKVAIGVVLGLALSAWMFSPVTPKVVEDTSKQDAIEVQFASGELYKATQGLLNGRSGQARYCHQILDVATDFERGHDEKDRKMVLDMYANDCT